MKGQKSRLRLYIVTSFILILSLIIYSGCAKKETIKSGTDEEVLRERVMAYWNYRVKQEFDKSYEFEDPIYRKKVSLVSYIKRFGFDPAKMMGVNIKGVQMEDSAAQLDLKAKIEVRAPGAPRPLTVDMDRKDRWGRIEGIWYHVIGEPSGKTGGRD